MWPVIEPDFGSHSVIILNIRVIFLKECPTLLFLHSSKLILQPLQLGNHRGGIPKHLYSRRSGVFMQDLGPGMNVIISSMCEKGQALFASQYCSCKISSSFHRHKVLNRTSVPCCGTQSLKDK